MTVFNRIREKVTSDEVIFQYRYGKLGSNWNPIPNIAESRRFIGTQRCEDVIPVGRYIPGNFKLRPVRLSKIGYLHAVLQGHAINSKGEVAHRWGGKFFFPLIGSFPSSYLPPVSAGSPSSRVLRNAYAGVNSPDNDWGESVAEASQTLRMITNPIAGCANILNKVFKGYGSTSFAKKSANSASWVASRWLEYRYGWNPAVSMVRDCLKDSGNLYPEFMRSRAKEQTETVTSTSARYSNSSQNYAFNRNCIIRDKTVWRAVVYYNVTDEAFFAAIKRGHTILNVPTLAWQLVPLSFAVDWWLNIGDWLYANMPNPSVNVLGNTLSHHRERLTTHFVDKCGLHPAPSSLYPWGPCSGQLQVEESVYERFVNVEAPTNVPIIDPRYNSWKHALDAAALAWQRGPSVQTLKNFLRRK